MIMPNATPTYFDDAARFHESLAKHHASERELLLGAYEATSSRARRIEAFIASCAKGERMRQWSCGTRK